LYYNLIKPYFQKKYGKKFSMKEFKNL